MVGGIDRYYQIARCMRDEDLRADRQFEFIQLDAEMSFVGQEDVLACITEAVVAAAVEAVTGERIGEIPRMTWREAMDRYGSDKPDIRFGMELVELTDVFARHRASTPSRPPSVKGIRLRRRRPGPPAAAGSTTSPTRPSAGGPRASCGCGWRPATAAR